MKRKNNLNSIVVIFIFHCCLVMSGQQKKKNEFGNINEKERALIFYTLDTTASAVYLYEYGENYFDVRNNYVWLIKKYHAKIKILKKDGFDEANIEIPFYHNDKWSEKILNIRAITHNEFVKTGVVKETVYDVDLSEKWSAKKFTFPDVKVGSILEYTYEVQSPFHFNLNGWDFQSHIPKLYTEYNAKIPGNWAYNRTLIGEINLDINEANLKKNCFSIPNSSKSADCEDLKYIMKNVPAFHEPEAFMISENNFKSRLYFELSEYTGFNGIKKKYTKSWKDVDREFKQDKNLGKQLTKKSFFEKNVPDSLFAETDLLTRAKKIYSFVKNHYTWDESYGIWNNNRVKNSFENRKGSATEINITLINLLNAAGITSNMMLIATRDKGLPTKSHPVMTDFNYLIVKSTIDGKEYLLDATDKNMPFGILPFKCLNYYGRVMDFAKESYWHDIVAYKNNRTIIRASAIIDSDNGNLTGVFNTINQGYFNVDKRKKLISISNQNYLDNIEDNYDNNFEITDYELKTQLSNDYKIIEKFNFEIGDFTTDGDIYLNPFFFSFFENSPFKSNERYYPIDFGYTKVYNYSLSIKVPDDFKLKTLPKPKLISLSDNAGLLNFKCEESMKGVLNVFFEFKLNKPNFSVANYQFIKQFFEEAVTTQSNSYIVLEKI